MKIVHTSDWHVGRRWKGIQRLDELEAVLDHLAAFIEEHSIDLVLHTGDVFESRNPPAEAEQLVNRFLVRVGRTGAQMLAVAGNHDDPLRLDARSLLTENLHVQILGRPRSASRGGTRVIATRSGEKAVVAALPGTASYVALGHIHKPQKIDAPAPAYYAGSLLQMDFGEAGEEKSFVVVTASPGKPVTAAQIEHIPYKGGLPLVDLRGSLAE